MAIVKIIELIAQSDKSWEDAAQSAITEASKTIHGIRSIYVRDLHAKVEHGKIVRYRLNAKLSFEIRDEERPKKSRK
jgi:flavin-binding protein dodecin